MSNFSGVKRLSAVPLFRRMLDELLAPRLLAASSALLIPFGDAASSGLRHLIDAGVILEDRVLGGFPHPSGANGHRKRHFEERREELASTMKNWFSRRRAIL
jgi:hypothetical protein